MIDNPEDLKEKALANKPGLRRQYVKYDEIFEALEAGNENGLEAIVKQIIEDYEEESEEE